MPKFNRRESACDNLVEAITAIKNGNAKTPSKLNRDFLEALTQFAATMTGNTSVIASADDEIKDFMFLYHQ